MKLTTDYLTLIDLISTVFCTITALSAFLYLNHLPGGFKRLWEKLAVYSVLFGSVAVAVDPFFFPQVTTVAEVLLRGGTSAFAVWLTVPLWYELPPLNRRRLPRFEKQLDGPGAVTSRLWRNDRADHA